MRKTLTFIAPLALTAGLLAAGPAAHAAPAPARAAMTPPSTPTELVHDLRAVLHHAGFQAKRAERGIPGRVDFVRSIERIDYHRPGICAQELHGFDPILDYLSTAIDGWGAAHHSGSPLWIWRDATAAESVTLWYRPARCSARALREARASLVIAHYTPPAAQPGR